MILQTNHVYVEDSFKGKITVYDDRDKIDPEEKFFYVDQPERAKARAEAEKFAAKQANRLQCGWGCNYEGR